MVDDNQSHNVRILMRSLVEVWGAVAVVGHEEGEYEYLTAFVYLYKTHRASLAQIYPKVLELSRGHEWRCWMT